LEFGSYYTKKHRDSQRRLPTYGTGQRITEKMMIVIASLKERLSLFIFRAIGIFVE
jgi:hypothetical protein